MQAGGARGAVGEAGGRPRCHSASSGCSVARQLHTGHLEGSCGPRGNLALTPGRGPGAAGPRAWEGRTTEFCFPLRAARRPLASGRGRPGGGAGQRGARIPRSSSPGGRETPCLLPNSPPSPHSGPDPGSSEAVSPSSQAAGVSCALFTSLAPDDIPEAKRDFRASQTPPFCSHFTDLFSLYPRLSLNSQILE